MHFGRVYRLADDSSGLGKLAEGSYTFRVDGGATVFECRFDQREPDTVAGAAGMAGDSATGFERISNVGCVRSCGSAGPLALISVGRQVEIRVEVAPEAVQLSVALDGNEVHQEELTPSYTKFYPNGRDCDKKGCRTGTASVELTELR